MSGATQAAAAKRVVVYPERDGKPLGETGFHGTAILHAAGALRYLLREEPDAYVGFDMLMFYEEGNPKAFRVPDVFVVRGVGSHERKSYKLWEEGAAPAVVVEVTSPKTREVDLGPKRELYERIGVKEYFMFDPLEEYLSPRLLGFRLAGSVYAPMAPEADGALRSDVLGTLFKPVGLLLRVIVAATGEMIPTLEEATAEVARATAETTRAEAEAARATAEASRAKEAEQRAKMEAAASEAEVRALRARLEELERKQT